MARFQPKADDEDLDVANRTVCEFSEPCENPVFTWTSLYGVFYPVCVEHEWEATS